MYLKKHFMEKILKVKLNMAIKKSWKILIICLGVTSYGYNRFNWNTINPGKNIEKKCYNSLYTSNSEAKSKWVKNTILKIQYKHMSILQWNGKNVNLNKSDSNHNTNVAIQLSKKKQKKIK
jgi:hypothetical protein